MRKALILLFGLYSSFVKAQVPDVDRYLDEMKGEVSAQKIAVLHAAPTGNYDLFYQRCMWSIDPDTLFIAGNITSCFTLTEDAESMYFDLSDLLTVDSVVYHGLHIDFSHTDNAVEIPFPVALNSGTIDSVTVFYQGNPMGTGFGSFEREETETGYCLWTLSEPYGASDWWPCKQTLNDKVDSLDVYISVPEGYKSGGPGLVQEVIHDGTRDVWHWKTRYPMASYLLGISISNFAEITLYAPHHEDSVLFYNLVYPEDSVAAFDGIQAIIPSFVLYTDIYGDYPYADEKYGHMQFGWGGGMEHQTMSSVTNFGYDLLNHEMAHQWFGDKITCASWRDIWLNEGFATYSSWLCYDFRDDPEHYYEAWLKGSRKTVTSQAGGSVWVDDTTEVSRVFDGRLSYYKGAWLLHMLRHQLGDTHFFNAIQSYISDPDLVFGFAYTDDLVAHFETEADTSLTTFFTEWFYGEGYPQYRVMWNDDGDGNVRIALSQETTMPASVPFFHMNVPLRLLGDTDSMVIQITHTQNGQITIVHPPFAVREVLLDPDITLLHANDSIVEVDLMDGVIPAVLFPNPADAILHVQVFTGKPDTYTFTLFNCAADAVLRKTIDMDAQESLVDMDVSALPAGVYVLFIESNSGQFIQKCVIK